MMRRCDPNTIYPQKELMEDLFEIKPSEVFERFLIKEKMETDKEMEEDEFLELCKKI